MNLWSDSKGFHRKTQKMIPAVILSWVSFHVFSFSAVVSSSRSLHIKNSTSYNAELKKKRQSTAVNLVENAVQSESGCFCVVCVSISIVDLFTKSFGVFVAFLMKLHVFTFWIFFVVMMVSWRRAELPLVLLDCGTTSELVLCTWTQTKRQCRKKLKKKQKIKNKQNVVVICSNFVYIEMKKKYWHWTKWTKNKKSIFYSVYMEIRFQYVALLCCTNQMCLWHFSNLIYFIVFFVFLLHH